ncbi:MAG: flavodoxin family protein [Promethearchaeota archaeon]
MKVVVFNGSPRSEGNTSLCLNMVMDELKSAGIETEYIWMGMDKIQGCISCYQCAKNKDKKCGVKTDKLNEYLAKMIEADGIILGSPTYFADMTARMKALIERAGLVSKMNGELLKHKVGASVVAVRRAVVGSSYWNLGIGLNPGDVLKDTEGKETFKNLGKNMAYLLQKLNT